MSYQLVNVGEKTPGVRSGNIKPNAHYITLSVSVYILKVRHLKYCNNIIRHIMHSLIVGDLDILELAIAI